MTKDLIQQQFGANAEAYVNSKLHARGASLQRLLALVDPQPDWDVLDIATGAGHTALAFAPLVARVVAADITPEMLVQAQKLALQRKLLNVETDTADAEALPYDNSSFNLVTCRIAPHHFGDIPLFAREAARVLQPGGLLAVVDNVVPPGPVGDYINAFEKLRDPSHGRCLSIAEWQSVLRGAGFTVEHQETLGKEMPFDFWAKRHDLTMQSYLRAMLSQSSAVAADFLKPRTTGDKLFFNLLEGIFISRKAVYNRDRFK